MDIVYRPNVWYTYKSSFRFSCAPCYAGSVPVNAATITKVSRVRRVCAQYIVMAKKLYVGGIPYSSTDADLKAHFETCGPVESATIIMDKMTGRSKGFGFVEMVNDADADKAVDTMHDTDFQGRKLTVSPARPQERRF